MAQRRAPERTSDTALVHEVEERALRVRGGRGLPKELHRRLGFDELGHYVKFFEPRT
jgi:hypothetical protein